MKTKISVTDWVNSIKTGDYIWSDDAASSFPIFLVRRNLICESTIMELNKTNTRKQVLDKKLAYDLFFHGTPREMKTAHARVKPTKLEKEYLQCIKDYYGYNGKRGREVLKILKVEQLEQIKTSQFKGGRS